MVQGFVASLALVIIFINALDAGIENTLMKSVNNSKLGGVASILKDRIKISN